MKTTRSKKMSDVAESVAETVMDVALGGTALAADKAIETVERAGEAVRKGRREVRETAETATRAVRKAFSESDARPYEDRTRKELYDLATLRDIEGRSSMRKAELIDALRSER